MSHERTRNPYATHGPDGPGGESWHEFFQRVKGRGVDPETGEDDPDEDGSERVVRITIPAEPIKKYPRALAPYVALLVDHGWEIVGSGHSGAVHDPVMLKSGEGVRFEEHFEEQYWVNAVRNKGEGVTISVNYRDGKAQSQRHARTVHGRIGLLTDKEMREVITSEDSDH